MEGFALTPTQRRLVDRGRSEFRARVVFSTPDGIDRETVAQRLVQAVSRHEVLRTRLETPTGFKQPVQIVDDTQTVQFDLDGNRLTLDLPAYCLDARSAVLLARELSGTAALDDDPLQYADAADWLNEMLDEPDGAEARAFWKAQIDAPAPDIFAPFEGADLVDTLGRSAPALAEQDDPVAFALAAWAAVLTRLHGERTPKLGVVLPGRPHDDLQSALGAYARCGPLRLGNEDLDVPFSDWVDDARAKLEEVRALEAQLLLPAECPDMRAAFAFEDHRDLPDGWRIESLQTAEPASSACMVVVRGGEGWSLRLRHAPDAVSTARAEVLIEQVAAFINEAATKPDMPAIDVGLVPEAHKALLLTEWSPPVAPPNPERLEQVFLSQAKATPDAPAVIQGDTRVSYSDIAIRARSICSALNAVGIARGDRVGLLLERGADVPAAIFGTLMAGATYVPIDPEYPQDRIEGMIEDGGLSITITDHTDTRFGPNLALESVQASDNYAPDPNADVDDTAYVIYTSGSTGRPKGVEITHRQLHASNAARKPHYGGGPESFLLLSSYAFDSSVVGLYWTLTTGGCLIFPERGEDTDPERLAKIIEIHAIRTLLAVPSLYHLILEHAARLSSLRRAVVAGEGCPPSVLARHLDVLPSCAFHNEYGPTEGTVWSTAWCANNEVPRLMPIGTPIAGARAYVVDKRGKLAPVGAAGELVIGGAGVAKGYLNRPEETALRFGDDPFGSGRIYHTGDLVRWNEGVLEYLGRIDNQVKVRGFRVELEEVETLLAGLPGVSEAAATVHGEGASARLVGYLVCDRPLDTEAMRTQLSERLPAFMVPGLVRIDAIPKTANHKIDRSALPDPSALESSLSTPFVAPRDPVEKVVAGIWGQVLNAPKVGLDDDFFELGGTSLLVTQVIARMRKAFRVDIPLVSLFDNPTVGRLVGYLRTDGPRKGQMDDIAPLVLQIATGSMDEARKAVVQSDAAE